MAESGWVRHSLSIGVFEFRRTVRDLWQDKARFTLTALVGVIPSLIFVSFLIVFADSLPEFGSVVVSGQLRGSVALFWLFASFIITQRVVSARTRIEGESLMLTTVSARTAAGGLLVAELLRVVSYFGLPLLVLTGTGMFLLSSPASLVLVPTTALFFIATAVITGSMVGYAVAWLVATSRFIARHKTVLGSAVSLIAMGGYFLFLYPQIGGLSQASLAWLPVGWFADLAVVGTPLVGSSLRSAGALLGSVVLIVIGGVTVERETTAFWFSEPVSADAGETAHGSATGEESSIRPSRRDALAAAVKPLVIPHFVSAPVRRVAEWTLLRTRRDPNRLTFLLIPVFAIGSSLVSAGLQSGSLRVLAAPVSAVLFPWLVGALFAMNPFGDEGAVLPVTLTAVSGKQYVRGLMTPGLVLGLPVVIVVTSIAGVFSPYPLAARIGLVVLGMYLTCVAVAITPAIGMALPRFSAISVGRSQDVLPPRMSAVLLHLLVITIPGGLLVMLITVPELARGLFAVVFGSLPAFVVGSLTNSANSLLSTVSTWFEQVGEVIRALGISQLQVVVGGVLIVGEVVALFLLYRNAIRRFERYSPL